MLINLVNNVGSENTHYFSLATELDEFVRNTVIMETGAVWRFLRYNLQYSCDSPMNSVYRLQVH